MEERTGKGKELKKVDCYILPPFRPDSALRGCGECRKAFLMSQVAVEVFGSGLEVRVKSVLDDVLDGLPSPMVSAGRETVG